MRGRQCKATYITWDGPDQNYLESLFLPIFGRIVRRGFDFSVLQFAWGESLRRMSTLHRAAEFGIAYEVRKIIRRPLRPATLAMILVGAARIVSHARAHSTEVLIPRSIIPGAMTLLAHQQLPELDIVYDSDGFVADERVEFDGWSATGFTYRLFRQIETRLCRRADSVITRSNHAARILKRRVGDAIDGRDIYVVPNGKEPSQFSPSTPETRQKVRRRLGVDDRIPLVVYAGSLGDRYLPEHIFRFFAAVERRRPDSHFLVLTGHRQLARQMAAGVELSDDSLTIECVSPEQVPDYLAAADLGVCFRKDTFSQQCVCPIKLAEYLLCGLPVAVTSGLGDVDRQISAAEGIVLSETTPRALAGAVDDFVERVLPDRDAFRQRCRQTGLRHFALDHTARGYVDAICRARHRSGHTLGNPCPGASRWPLDPAADRDRSKPMDTTISRAIFGPFRP